MFQCKSGKGELEADLNAGLSCCYGHTKNIIYPLEQFPNQKSEELIKILCVPSWQENASEKYSPASQQDLLKQCPE